MLRMRKRGQHFHLDLVRGRVHVVRGSLGTGNRDAALRLVHRLEIALSEGPRSPLWPELRNIMPPPTFTRFANLCGVKEKLIPTWEEFRGMVERDMDLRVKLNELEPKTVCNYGRTLRMFDIFLSEHHINTLPDIDQSVIDDYKQWRIDKSKRGNSKGDWHITVRPRPFTSRVRVRNREGTHREESSPADS